MSKSQAERRLQALPHHLVVADVLPTTPRHQRMLDAMDWLYDYGPANLDWYVDEKDGNREVVNKGGINQLCFTTTWTFAFRHAKDAMLFKLMFL